MLDYRCGNPPLLLEALALSDGELIAALGGRRREELAAQHAAWPRRPAARPRHHAAGSRRRAERSPAAGRAAGPAAWTGSAAICRHDPGWPATLGREGAPHLLHLSPAPARFVALAARPCVAILGATAPSEYGRAVARSLARSLALAGVTVVAPLRDGIAAAAHEGALDTGSGSIALFGDGLGNDAPASLRALARRLPGGGVLAAELPDGAAGRRWGARAADRALATLAVAAVLVEDREDGAAAWTLGLAASQGKPVGAVPGQVTSPLARGPHVALATGAKLVSCGEDVLELLALTAVPAPADGTRAGLSRPLQSVLDRIGAGYDTPEALIGLGVRRGEAMAALAELELIGLVSRTAAGRYAPAEPARPRPSDQER